jgi:hypothetical protein
MNHHNRCLRFTALALSLFAAGRVANAQFKVVGPAPYPPPVAHQKIKTLLEGVDPTNPKQTIDTLSGLLSWYREIVDDELIAAWRKDGRANLTIVVQSLADLRVASDIIEFSWREQRQAAFSPAYAAMFTNLMTRFPESAKPFVDDIQQTPNLSQPVAETVCRILLDLPDIGIWRRTALQVLPHYSRVAENLLVQDSRGSDQEKSYQAQRWLDELKIDVPGVSPGTTNEHPSPRRRNAPGRTALAVNDNTPTGDQTAALHQLAPAPQDRPLAPAMAASTPPSQPSVPGAASVPAAPSSPTSDAAYRGPTSGTWESSGGPIPQHAEYVFRNVPPGKIQLDYDSKTWDVRLVPGDGQTRKLIVRNKGSDPQKRCVVRWSIVP